MYKRSILSLLAFFLFVSLANCQEKKEQSECGTCQCNCSDNLMTGLLSQGDTEVHQHRRKSVGGEEEFEEEDFDESFSDDDDEDVSMMPAEQVKPASLEKKKSTGSFFGLLRSSKGGESSLAIAPSTRFFGAPLDSLKELLDGVPRPIKECLCYLWEKTATEGLFRLSASVKDLEMARMAVDKGIPLSFSPLANNSGQEHIAASLIKSFLRELPTPILGSSQIEEVEDVDLLRQFIHGLPAINQRILMELFRVLRRIDAEKEVSKMDASNLAVVVGPNLMWIQDDVTGERISPSVATKIAFQLIQNYDAIFGVVTEIGHKASEAEEKDQEDTPPPPESNQTDLDIIISAIYELQKEIYDLKALFEAEVSKREALEEFIRKNFDSKAPVDSILPSSVEDLEIGLESDQSSTLGAEVSREEIEK